MSDDKEQANIPAKKWIRRSEKAQDIMSYSQVDDKENAGTPEYKYLGVKPIAREFWISEHRLHECDCISEGPEKPNIADCFGPFQVIELSAFEQLREENERMFEVLKNKLNETEAGKKIFALEAELEKAKAELEERRIATPTMNALHTAVVERDQALAKASDFERALEQILKLDTDDTFKDRIFGCGVIARDVLKKHRGEE